jgi:hypothetical protein
MNSKTTIIGLVAAIAVLSGAMGLSVTGAFSDQTIAQSTIPATGMLMGQVMIEAHNADGEMIAYRLGDNEVVDGGEQCILRMLFSTAADGTGGPSVSTAITNAGYSVCTGALTAPWTVIAIGVGVTDHDDAAGLGDSAVADLYSGLEIECNANNNAGGTGADAKSCAGQAGLIRATATTKTWQNGTSDTETQIVLAKTFTSLGSAVVTESGLFNSTNIATGGMLAHKTFGAVTLTSGDSITVTWTFKVGD